MTARKKSGTGGSDRRPRKAGAKPRATSSKTAKKAATPSKRAASAGRKKASGARKKTAAKKAAKATPKKSAKASSPTGTRKKAASSRPKQTAAAKARTGAEKTGSRAKRSDATAQRAARTPAKAAAKPKTRAKRPTARTAPTGPSALEREAHAVLEAIPVPIGRIAEVYAGAGAIAVTLTADLREGDMILVRGATSDFFERVASLQLDGVETREARAGSSVGIGLGPGRKARVGDRVFRVSA